MPDKLWRYGQAGDLPGIGDSIDKDDLLELARANRRRSVIAFTHKPMTPPNLSALKEARDLGFNVNLSANCLQEVDELAKHGLPVVTVLPQEYQRRQSESLSDYRVRLKTLKTETDGGIRVAVCVATYTKATCKTCGVCAKPRSKNVVIGFPAHGSKASKMDVNFQPPDSGVKNDKGNKSA